MSSRIDIEQYHYEEIYPSFKAGTDEKELTANLNRRFLRRLLGDGIPASNRPLKVADIGCGPCDTILMYLDRLDYAPGFRIRATDYNLEYADPQNGKAVLALREVQRAGRIPIVDFSVRNGDAFAGRLLELLSAAGEEDSRKSFDLVFASHMLYHAGAEALVHVMLNDVLTNLLHESGIAMLYHAAPDPGSLVDFRARYGRRSLALEASDTPAVNVGDPTASVAGYCANQQLPYLVLKFETKLFMAGLTDDHWRLFREPRRYAELAKSDPVACENLRRLMFVTQRAPLEFVADSSSSGLTAYLREVRSVIERNGGYLGLSERLQVVCRRDVSASVVNGARAALEELQGPAST
jgi:hypothetical protein